MKANYFIENYNYEVVIITLNEVRSEPFFECNSLIKFIHLPKKSIIGSLAQFSNINKILKAEIPDFVVVVVVVVVVVPIDNTFGLYLLYFINRKFPFVYERHNAKNVNVNQKTTPSFKDKIYGWIKKKLIDKGGKCYDKFVLLSEDHVQE